MKNLASLGMKNSSYLHVLKVILHSSFSILHSSFSILHSPLEPSLGQDAKLGCGGVVLTVVRREDDEAQVATFDSGGEGYLLHYR